MSGLGLRCTVVRPVPICVEGRHSKPPERAHCSGVGGQEGEAACLRVPKRLCCVSSQLCTVGLEQ